MNIKTRLTDEEIDALTTNEEFKKYDCRERVIEARASAKTKRVMFEGISKIGQHEYIDGLGHMVVPWDKWEEFKKWALGE